MLEKDENNYSEGFIPSQNSGEIIHTNTTDNSNPFESKESEEQIDQDKVQVLLPEKKINLM